MKVNFSHSKIYPPRKPAGHPSAAQYYIEAVSAGDSGHRSPQKQKSSMLMTHYHSSRLFARMAAGNKTRGGYQDVYFWVPSSLYSPLCAY